MFKHILQSNSDNVLKKLDYSGLNKEEVFYLYKNTENKKIQIMTWSTNSWSKYIDELGNNITNLEDNLWKTYRREFIHKWDILKHKINPNEISNIVFHLDAQNINGTWWTQPHNWDNIIDWVDISWNNLNAHSPNWWNNLTFSLTWLDRFPMIKFWTGAGLNIVNNGLINDDNNSWNQIIYDQKSMGMVLKTWDNVMTAQTIYEAGGISRWYNIMIENGTLYAWVWNTVEWDWWDQYKTTTIGEITTDTVYFITMVQNSLSNNDNNNTLSFYINWYLSSEVNHVDPQYEHNDEIGIGAVQDNTVHISTESDIYGSGLNHEFLNWWISEIISWNYALSETEVKWLNNYFKERWWEWQQNINYSIIETNISKYNSN